LYGNRCTFYEKYLDVEEMPNNEIKMRGYVERLECLCVLRSKRVDCWRKDWDKAVVILMVVLKWKLNDIEYFR